MRKNSYPQVVPIVIVLQYILWLMKMMTQDVDNYCGYVDK